MNSPAQETDDTHVHLQTLLHRVRQALNECPADNLLTVHTLRAWLDIRIRYEEELKAMLDATREANSLSDPNHLMLQAGWMRAEPAVIDNPDCGSSP
jgi:hypothetical protein